MDTSTLYELIQSKTNITERKKYIQTLTEEQKKAYTRYGNKIRQAKFASGAENKEKYNKKRADHHKAIRLEEPEKHRLLNIKYVGEHRSRKKDKVTDATKTNYKVVVKDVIKAALIKDKKAKLQEYQKAYKERLKSKQPKIKNAANKIANDLLNEIIDKAVPKTLKKKKHAEYMRNWRKAQKAK